MLDRYGVEPSLLVLEITETAAIPDIDRARRFCAAVLELGCELALDDFGAGYGGLHLLRELPFSFLKIDGDFIRRLPSSRTDQLIVRRAARARRAAWPARRSPSASPTSARSRSCADIGVELAQGFELGRPAPLLAARRRSARPAATRAAQ